MTSDLHRNEDFFSTYMETGIIFLLLLQPLKQNKKSSLRKPVEISGAIAHLQNFLPLPRWWRPVESHKDVEMPALHQT